jgi:hypothetical protein
LEVRGECQRSPPGRRLLCITPMEIYTQDPAAGLRITNTYSIGQDADIDGLSLGPGPEEFTLAARADRTSRKFAPLRFSCRQRAALLTDLYQCVAGGSGAAGSPAANAGLAYKLLRCVACGTQPGCLILWVPLHRRAGGQSSSVCGCVEGGGWGIRGNLGVTQLSGIKLVSCLPHCCIRLSHHCAHSFALMRCQPAPIHPQSSSHPLLFVLPLAPGHQPLDLRVPRMSRVRSTSETFAANRWSRKQGCWMPVALQCACFQMTCTDMASGEEGQACGRARRQDLWSRGRTAWP